MSRIGRMPVPIPAGVKCEILGAEVSVQGPKGQLSWHVPGGVKVSIKDGILHVEMDTSVRMIDRELSARQGLVRAHIQNMVTGVVQGYERKLEMRGQGYRPQIQGNKLTMTLGFSKPVVIDLPEGVKAASVKVEVAGRAEERYLVTLSACDKMLVGELAARIRRIKKADVYKGKGIRFAGEYVRQKAGKATVAAGTGGK